MTVEVLLAELDTQVGQVMVDWMKASPEARHSLAAQVRDVPVRLAASGWKVRMRTVGTQWQVSAGREVEGKPLADHAEESTLEDALWKLLWRLDLKLNQRMESRPTKGKAGFAIVQA